VSASRRLSGFRVHFLPTFFGFGFEQASDDTRHSGCFGSSEPMRIDV